MRKLWTLVRAAAVMGLTWGLAWGLIGGFVMEAIVDPNGRIVDMWPQVLAISGVLGGAFFSLVLGLSARAKKFSELSLGRFTLWGTLAGLMLGGFFMLTGAGPFILIPMTVLCTASATGTLALARKGDKPELIDAG